MSSLQKVPSPGKLLTVLGLTLLLGSIQAAAEEHLRIIPSIEISQEFDSDVLRDDRNDEDDFVTRLSPKIRFSSENGRGHAYADLGLTQRYYQELDELDALDWYGSWDVDRKLTPRLSFLSEGKILFLENNDGINEGANVIVSDRVDTRDRNFAGGLSYMLDASNSISGLVGYSDVKFSLGEAPVGTARRDRDTRYAVLRYLRTLSAKDQVGLSLRAAKIDYESVGAAGAQEDDLYAFAGSWSRIWSPLWTTHLTAGLRSLDTEFQGNDDSSTSFVGGLALERSIQGGSARLSYNRETRPSSGFGTSLDQDVVDAAWERRLSDRVTLRLDGQYARLTSATESTFQRCFAISLLTFQCLDLRTFETEDEIDTRTFAAGARLSWRLAKTWSTYASYRFRDQESRGDRQLNDFNTHRFMIGFRAERPVAIR